MSHNTIPSAQPPARRNQLDVLEDIAGGIDALVEAGPGGGGSGVDKELVNLAFTANKNFTGASQGDLITSAQVIDLTGASPVVGNTVWYNQTTRALLASPPLAADLDMAGGGGGASNAQLIAALSNSVGAQADAPSSAPTSGATSISVLKGLWRAFNDTMGFNTDSAIATPATTGTVQAVLRGLWTSLTGVASGTADSGNPVKTGGRYSTAALALTNNQRSDTMVSLRGSSLVATDFGSASGGDAIASTVARYQTDRLGADSMPIMANALFDGTNWLRARGTVNGAWTQGNVAHNGTDVGNPVKVGGTYLATVPALVDGRRGDLQLSPRAALVTTADMSTNAVADATADTAAALSVNRAGVEKLSMTGTMVFDPLTATYARARGGVAGAFVQGNVASNATDSGNPLKVGGVYKVTPTNLTDGQRGDLRLGFSSALVVSPLFGPSPAGDGFANNNVRGIADAGNNVIVQAVGNWVFNGASWDRAPGDTTGFRVNTLKTPLVARQVAVTTTTAPTQLTSNTKRISIVARGADMRFAVANATVVANATTSHFIRQDERLEFDVGQLGTSPWIAVIIDVDSPALTGKFDISELN